MNKKRLSILILFLLAIIVVFSQIVAAETYPSIGGRWYMGGPYDIGMPCSIEVSGNSIEYINEKNQKSSGKFIDSTTIVASEWENGLKGHITDNGKRINWDNGTWWVRDNPNSIKGTWYMAGSINIGMPCSIEVSGNSIEFINEKNQKSSGYFIDSTTVIATDWENGLKGHITDNNKRINWENKSWWTRDKPSI